MCSSDLHGRSQLPRPLRVHPGASDKEDHRDGAEDPGVVREEGRLRIGHGGHEQRIIKMVMKNPPAQAGGFSLRGISVKEGWRLGEAAIPLGLLLGL